MDQTYCSCCGYPDVAVMLERECVCSGYQEWLEIETLRADHSIDSLLAGPATRVAAFSMPALHGGVSVNAFRRG